MKKQFHRISVSQYTGYSASMVAYINQQEKIFIAKKGHSLAKNGHFQDKKLQNQLVLEQFYRISALQITGYS